MTDTAAAPAKAVRPESASAPTSRAHTSATNRRAVRILLGLLLPAVIIGTWQWATGTGILQPYQLPTPVSVWRAAVALSNRGVLWRDVEISTQRVLIGFAIGAAIGLAVGAIVGLSRLADILVAPTVGAIRAIPSLAWVPLIMLWLKIGEDSKITLIAIGAFFPVYTTVSAALRHVDQHFVEAGRAYGLRGPSLLARVQLPAVLPAVVAGLRLALAQSWLFLVAAELIASSMGLGFLLTDSQNNGRVDRIILAIIVLALLGKASDAIIGLAEKYLLNRWS
jgi:sulfonate transport system permease protein